MMHLEPISVRCWRRPSWMLVTDVTSCKRVLTALSFHELTTQIPHEVWIAVGLDIALEALKSYSSQRNMKVDLLTEYAKALRVAKTMRPYRETLL